MIVLARHSIREPIREASLEAASRAALTDAGRELARDFGERLPVEARLRLFSSPVGRCVETARLVGEAFEARGGVVEDLGTRGHLGGEFILDPAGVISVFAASGPRGFMRAWHDGRLGDGAILPPERAARELLAALLAEQAPGRRGPGIDLQVTHDLTVAALLGLVLDNAAPGFPWPGYLDGVAIRACGSGLELWYQGASHELPVPPRP